MFSHSIAIGFRPTHSPCLIAWTSITSSRSGTGYLMLENVVSVLGASLENRDNSNMLLFVRSDAVPMSLALTTTCFVYVRKPWYHMVIPWLLCSIIKHVAKRKYQHAQYRIVLSLHFQMCECALPLFTPAIARFRACGTICLRVRPHVDADTLAHHFRQRPATC